MRGLQGRASGGRGRAGRALSCRAGSTAPNGHLPTARVSDLATSLLRALLLGVRDGPANGEFERMSPRRTVASVAPDPCRSAGVAGALLLPGPVRVAGRIFMHGALLQGDGARPGSGGRQVLALRRTASLARSTVLSRSKRSRTGDRNAPAAPRRRIGIAEAASGRHREPSCRPRQRGTPASTASSGGGGGRQAGAPEGVRRVQWC